MLILLIQIYRIESYNGPRINKVSEIQKISLLGIAHILR